MDTDDLRRPALVKSAVSNILDPALEESNRILSKSFPVQQCVFSMEKQGPAGKQEELKAMLGTHMWVKLLTV